MIRKIKETINWCRTWGTLPVPEWAEGARLYKQRNFKQALKHYQTGLTKRSQHPARHCARLDYAYCLFRVGKAEEAEEELKRVVRDVPKSHEAVKRLVELQRWYGRDLDAAWTLKHACERFSEDVEFICNFAFAAIDGAAGTKLFNQVDRLLTSLELKQEINLSVKLARAVFDDYQGRRKSSREVLSSVACQNKSPWEAKLYLAEKLLSEGLVLEARSLLRQALSRSPNHPRLLARLADTYLEPGLTANTDYAIQLASKAAQSCAWQSARELHSLARAFRSYGDKVSALMVASKAQSLAKEKPGIYPYSGELNKLVDALSAGTLA